MTTPIATYTERLLQVRRVFTLYPDHVLVLAHWRFKGRYKNTIPLASLKPTTREVYIRYWFFRYAALIALIGLVLIAWTLYPTVPWPLPPATIVGIVLVVVGLILSALTYPRILFVRFDARQGGSGLDIARAGSNKAQFDAFIEAVRRQIKKAQKNQPNKD